MGLIQAELERRGIATASITMMPGITRAVGPPRALAVPYGLGYPLGRPGAPALHRAILLRLLALVRRTDVPLIDTMPDEPNRT